MPSVPLPSVESLEPTHPEVVYLAEDQDDASDFQYDALDSDDHGTEEPLKERTIGNGHEDID